MKRILIFVLFFALLSACAPSPESIQTAIAQTLVAWTPIPTQTPYPTYTPFPTATIIPSQTAKLTTTASASDHFAWNYIASQESGGIKIVIARLLIAEKTTIDEDFDIYHIFDDVSIVGEIVFKITNQSEKVVSIYPDQGTVIIGSEQIELSDYMMLGTFGDALGGEIYSGITKIGGIWFGIKRTAIDEIKSISIIINAPYDAGFNTLGKEFNFVIDLSERKNEPLPEDLK